MASLGNNILYKVYPIFLFDILHFQKISHSRNKQESADLYFILFLEITALGSRRGMQYSNSCFRNIIGNSVKDIMTMEELRQKANLRALYTRSGRM